MPLMLTARHQKQTVHLTNPFSLQFAHLTGNGEHTSSKTTFRLPLHEEQSTKRIPPQPLHGPESGLLGIPSKRSTNFPCS
ncbi:hypothetical protein Hanom_Chr02g00163601 [Helianthus anomalus]